MPCSPAASKTAARNLFEAINLKLGDICRKITISFERICDSRNGVFNVKFEPEACCVQLVLLVAYGVDDFSSVFLGFG